MNTLKEIGAVVALAAALAVILSLYMPPARADAALYRAIGENPAGQTVEVVLHDEPCALEAIANLPKRATWTEPGKTYEGCWGPDPHLPIVQVYWSDRTVVAIPRRALVPLTRI
jgi:hypothetical protein